MTVKYRNYIFLLILATLLGFGAVKVLSVYNKENKKPISAAFAPKPPLAEAIFYNAKDQPVRVSDFKGKVLLVNLWATWCPPCVAELASLDSLQARLGDEGFKVIAISLDRKDMQQVTDFLAERGVEYLEAYWDKDRNIPMKWTYGGIPQSFLIDRDGSVLHVYEGAYKWDEGGVFDEIQAVVR